MSAPLARQFALLSLSAPPYYLSCPYLPNVSLGLAGPME